MPFLEIRDVPDDLYRLVVEQAEKEHRSLAQQAVAVLARGLEVELDAKARRQKVLRAIKESGQRRTAKLKDPAS